MVWVALEGAVRRTQRLAIDPGRRVQGDSELQEYPVYCRRLEFFLATSSDTHDLALRQGGLAGSPFFML